MSDSTMAVSSKYTQDLSVQIVFFTFSCKWFLCFYFWAVIWSYIVDLFAALHELASARARTLLKLASSVRALLKPYGDTLSAFTNFFVPSFEFLCIQRTQTHSQVFFSLRLNFFVYSARKLIHKFSTFVWISLYKARIKTPSIFFLWDKV